MNTSTDRAMKIPQMDYSKLISSINGRRRGNAIRQITEIYLRQPANTVNFAGGMPNAETFPFADINFNFKNGISVKLDGSDLSTALQYGPTRGYPPLIDTWKGYLQQWHSPQRNDWDIVFTPGSADGCSRVLEMVLDQGDAVMVQSPTYTAIINMIIPLKSEFIGIPQDVDGIIPEEIEKVCEEKLRKGQPMPKILYVNPTGSNPTSSMLTEDRKRRVYELARKYNFLILEDDAYYFLHFEEEQPKSLWSMDVDGRVIRLDSFSKIFSPGIRTGVVIAHKDLINLLITDMENNILQTSSLSQMIIYKLFDSWTPQMFDNYFNDIREFYKKRRDEMVEAVEKHLTGLAEWTVPKGGLFLWLKVKGIENISDTVMNKCIPNGVFALPGNAFNYDVDAPDQHLRLCYSYATAEEIDKGIAKLAEVIKEELQVKQN